MPWHQQANRSFCPLYWAHLPVKYDPLVFCVSPVQNHSFIFAFLPIFNVLNDFQPNGWHLNLFLSLHKMSFPFTFVFILQHFFLPQPNNYSFPIPFLPPPGPLPAKASLRLYLGSEHSFLKLLQIVCLIVFGWGLVIFNKALNPSTSLKITRLLCRGWELKIAATLLGEFTVWMPVLPRCLRLSISQVQTLPAINKDDV